MSCKYAQREIKKDIEKLRCVNKQCDSFLNVVDLNLCSTCPFKGSNANENSGCYDCTKAGKDGLISEETTETVYRLEDLIEAGIDAADFDPNNPPEMIKKYPPITEQVWNYQNALRKWNSEGRPVRTPEEIKDILETHCKGCSWYDKDKERCKGCGCKVTEGGIAIFNKIKMATEHCPQELW